MLNVMNYTISIAKKIQTQAMAIKKAIKKLFKFAPSKNCLK